MANNEKNRITIVEIKEIYPIARDVFEGRKTLDDGVEYLVKDVEMNKGNAENYINFIIRLKKGDPPPDMRGVNILAADYFLGGIFADDGKSDLRIALESFSAHIEYYEKIRKCKLRGFRRIREKFLAKLK